MAQEPNWADNPSVAGWMATDPEPTPSGPTATAYTDTTRVDQYDAPVDDEQQPVHVTGPHSSVRGGVGSDDPTEQFPAPTFDTAPEAAPASLVPTHHTAPAARGRGAHPGTDPELGLAVPSAVPAPGRSGKLAAWAGRYRWPLAIVAAVVVVLVATIAVLGSGGDDPAPKAAGPGIEIPSGQATAPAGANADCPTGTQGPTTTGRDAGGTDSGPAVIKNFEYAYYVERSGDKARAAVTPNAKSASGDPFSTGAQLQASIDKFIDPQTLHCLSITDRGAGLYAVALTETPPRGQNPTVYHQLIQTTTDRGRAWIVSITDDSPTP